MTSKNEGATNKRMLADALRHPEETFIKQLEEQKEIVIERQTLITDAALTTLVSQVAKKGPITFKALVMELSARRPYDATHGLVDMFMPGRWDATSDLIYMDPIVHSNPSSPGEWTGSVGYISFTPPSTAMYVIAVYFFGYLITMSLNGPAGTTTAFSSSNTSTAVVMPFTGTAGTGTGFSFACTGLYLGFVQAIRAFQL